MKGNEDIKVAFKIVLSPNLGRYGRNMQVANVNALEGCL